MQIFSVISYTPKTHHNRGYNQLRRNAHLQDKEAPRHLKNHPNHAIWQEQLAIHSRSDAN